MQGTKRSRGIKEGLTRLRTGKWRGLTVWVSTSEIDDVEICEAFLVQQGLILTLTIPSKTLT